MAPIIDIPNDREVPEMYNPREDYPFIGQELS